jgi:hypothetical protein
MEVKMRLSVVLSRVSEALYGERFSPGVVVPDRSKGRDIFPAQRRIGAVGALPEKAQSKSQSTNVQNEGRFTHLSFVDLNLFGILSLGFRIFRAEDPGCIGTFGGLLSKWTVCRN